MRLKEKIFIERINAKWESAFHQLFKYFYQYLVIFAKRYVTEQDAAEDIVQEIMISLWESPKQFQTYKGFRSYLYESVYNRCIDYLRHENIKNRYVEYYRINNSIDDLQQMEEEIYRELYLAVESLPPRCREVFELCLEGKKNGEIAKLLSLTLATVKTHKKNAVRLLKDKLKDKPFILNILGFI